MNKTIMESCPLCDGKQLKHTMTCADFCASDEQFELFTCESCHFTFTQNAPAGTEIDRYYETPQYISHSDNKKGVMHILYHLVRRITLIKKANLVIKEAHRRSGRILDIGTGTGYFPDMMIARGWKVKAIEKNAQARALAKELFELNVDDEAALNIYKPGTFDVITLWHVMEHLENLDDMWKKFYELLTEKGVLVVAVPNCSSYDALKYKEYWAAYDVPRHLWHFTPATMLQWGYKHNFILSARHPMSFDAFYISMLSEKYRKSIFPLLKGFYTGMAAWLSTQSKKERSSSIVYVFRKKQL